MLRKIAKILFALIFLLFLVRLAIPQHIKYLLFPLTAIFIVLSVALYIYEGRYRNFSLAAYRVFIPLLAVSLFVGYALFSTSYYSDRLVKDIINLLVVLGFIFALIVLDLPRQELTDALKKFATLTIWFGVLFAIAGIAKLYLQLRGIYLDFLKPEGVGYPQGTSLGPDDNFYTLVGAVGMLFIIPRLFKNQNRLKRIAYQLALYVIALSSLLATSRRGGIISFTLFGFYFITTLVSLFYRFKSNHHLLRSTWLFIILMLGSMVTWYVLLFRVDTLKRNRWLMESSFNRVEMNTYINFQVLSYESIFRGKTTYNEVSEQLWATTFDPRYPYSGWATGSYSLVDHLPQHGLSKVPSDAIGAQIGRGSSLTNWNGKALYYSKLFDVSNAENKRYLSSVYVYVSPDFNGSWVRLSTRGHNRGIRDWYYDMTRKGTWQQLKNSFLPDSTDSKVYFYVCRENDSTFNNLNGHVIFAYPQLQKIEYSPENPFSWAYSQFEPVEILPANGSELLSRGMVALKPLAGNVRYREKDSLLIFGAGLFRYNFQDSARIIPSLYVWVSPDFNGDEVYLNAGGKIYGFNKHSYDLTKKGTWQKLFLSYSMYEGSSWVDYVYRKKAKSASDSIRGYVLFANPKEKFIRFNFNEPIAWAGSNFKRVYPLEGSNAEIVPRGSVGMRIDRDAQARISKDLSYSSNPLKKIKIPGSNYRVKSSVYVYVSNDFSGKSVRLGGGAKELWGNSAQLYDLNKRGTWQKLTINNWGKADDEYYSTTYFENLGSKDFSNLKGYVIWASPSFKLMRHNPKDPETYTSSTYIREYPLEGRNTEIVPAGVAGARYSANTEGNQWKDIYHSSTHYWGLPVEVGDSIFASVYCYVSPDFDGNEARVEIRGKVNGPRLERYNLNERGKWVLLKAKAVATGKDRVYGVYFFSKKGVTDFSNLKGYVTFAYPQLVVKSGKISVLNTMRNLNIAGLMAQANGSETDAIDDGFVPTMTDDHFAGPRIDRWRYALYIYANEYSTSQKLFGGGFDYTKKFARKFLFNEPSRDYDYPHNPFLSALLYSGLLGFVIYLWFYVRAVYLYYKHRRQYWIFGVAFLITFFYSFFSSNLPFEPGIFGVLSALPYIIGFVEGKNEIEKINS